MRENKSTWSKWQVFILTFSAYAFQHTMRMSWGQVKPEFSSQFDQTHLFLGVFDAVVYISLGIGYLLRFHFSTKKSLIKIYFIMTTISSLAYLYIPISSIVFGQRVKDNFALKQLLPSLSLLIFGFCQAPSWPTLLTIMNHYFDVEKDGDIMGIWSACGDIGNIIGLVISGVLITVCHVRWQVLMITSAALTLLGTISVYFNIDQQHNQQIEDHKNLLYMEGQKEKETLSQSSQFWEFIKDITQKQENKLFLLSMALLKSILYAFLLWMPTYLATNNFAYYKSTVPIAFSIGTLAGSFCLGYLYNQVDFEQTDIISRLLHHLKVYALFYCCLGVTVIFAIFYFCKITILVYFILSFFCGAFLGGCFNMHASNEAISIVKGHRENVSKLSALSMAIGSLIVGVVEFIIEVALNLKDKRNGGHVLFVILMSIGIIAMMVLLRRSYLLSSKREATQEQEIEVG